jgi:PAS domain S-box-containing protein
MDAEKEKYIETHVAKLTQFWIGSILILGAILFILLGMMDFFVTPENFNKFIVYRVIISSLLIFLYFLNRQKIGKNYQYTIIMIGTALSAITIELMILSLGGHRSSYYAGMNLLIICVLGFVPFSLPLSFLGITIVYSVYLFPILLFDKITDWPYFISSNAFMISTFVIALVWRLLSQKSLMNELTLQYELDKERHKLEEYSVHLENLVQERTSKLSASEKKYKELFENANDGIMIMDRNGIILNANQKAYEIHGFEKDALIGINIELLEREENKQLFKERMSRILDGESLLFETQHYRKDGSKVSLEVSSKAVEVEGNILIQSFHRDITEKKKIQEHLFQSQKMESIGTLAGGIAHDFNNILTAILGHVELIRINGKLDEKTIKGLNVIEDASRRATDMISKLLGFARRSTYEILPFNLNDVVGDAVKLLERVIDKRIQIFMELDRNIPLMEGDINQIEQVIVNLIVNAQDAISDRGCIVVSTSCINVKRGMPDVPSYITEGEYIVLKVSDTGCGIPDGTINNIFEPFFTTKERGKGTGLGLSMVYGTIKEHRGYITVQSKIGEGSIFTVYIPASSKITQNLMRKSFKLSRP